jgi:hypothetical protein
MAKFFASDRRAVEVQVEGVRTGTTRTYRADKKGFYEVNNAADAKSFKESGMVEASLMGTTDSGVGFLCNACGFGSWFRVCGRCGHEIGDVECESTTQESSSS